MKAVSALNQLLVLSDETLTVLNLETLDLVRHSKLKGVGSFCLNENPTSNDPFTVEICVAARKKIQYMFMTSEQINLKTEFSTNNVVTALAMDGVNICYAIGLDYCMLNIQTGEVQKLFGRDVPEQLPIIQRIANVKYIKDSRTSMCNNQVI